MKKVVYVFILTFVLNFIWEVSQAFLYTSHYVGISKLIKVHFIASLGDILIISIIFLLSYMVSSFNFLKDKLNIKNFLLVIVIGFVVAVFVEKYFLMTGKWQYNFMMPVIPFLNVGLIPILQLMLIPAIVISFWSWIKNK